MNKKYVLYGLLLSPMIIQAMNVSVSVMRQSEGRNGFDLQWHHSFGWPQAGFQPIRQRINEVTEIDLENVEQDEDHVKFKTTIFKNGVREGSATSTFRYDHGRPGILETSAIDSAHNIPRQVYFLSMSIPLHMYRNRIESTFPDNAHGGWVEE